MLGARYLCVVGCGLVPFLFFVFLLFYFFLLTFVLFSEGGRVSGRGKGVMGYKGYGVNAKTDYGRGIRRGKYRQQVNAIR